MSYLWLIAGAGLVTYLTRVPGFYLGRWSVPDVVARFLNYVPVAAFAALAAPGIGPGADWLPRLLGAGVAAVLMLRFGQLWLCLVGGMLGFWAVAFLLGLSAP
jgi:branched-subunit amino acid transport protein